MPTSQEISATSGTPAWNPQAYIAALVAEENAAKLSGQPQVLTPQQDAAAELAKHNAAFHMGAPRDDRDIPLSPAAAAITQQYQQQRNSVVGSSPTYQQSVISSSGVNPYRSDTAAGIAWEVGKTGGATDYRLNQIATQEVKSVGGDPSFIRYATDIYAERPQYKTEILTSKIGETFINPGANLVPIRLNMTASEMSAGIANTPSNTYYKYNPDTFNLDRTGMGTIGIGVDSGVHTAYGDFGGPILKGGTYGGWSRNEMGISSTTLTVPQGYIPFASPGTGRLVGGNKVAAGESVVTGDTAANVERLINGGALPKPFRAPSESRAPSKSTQPEGFVLDVAVGSGGAFGFAVGTVAGLQRSVGNVGGWLLGGGIVNPENFRDRGIAQPSTERETSQKANDIWNAGKNTGGSAFTQLSPNTAQSVIGSGISTISEIKPSSTYDEVRYATQSRPIELPTAPSNLLFSAISTGRDVVKTGGGVVDFFARGARGFGNVTDESGVVGINAIGERIKPGYVPYPTPATDIISAAIARGGSSARGELSMATLGILVPPENKVITPEKISWVNTTQSGAAVSTPYGGNETISKLAAWFPQNEKNIDVYNKEHVDTWNTNLAIYKAMGAQNPSGVTVTTPITSTNISTTTPAHVHEYGEFDSANEWVGSWINNTIYGGQSPEDMKRREAQVDAQPGWGGVYARTTFGAQKFLTERPLDVLPAASQTAALVAGSELIGAGAVAYGGTSLFGAGAIKAITTPVVAGGTASLATRIASTAYNYAGPTALAGYGTWIVTEGFTATSEKIQKNVGYNIVPLIASLGTASGIYTASTILAPSPAVPPMPPAGGRGGVGGSTNTGNAVVTQTGNLLQQKLSNTFGFDTPIQLSMKGAMVHTLNSAYGAGEFIIGNKWNGNEVENRNINTPEIVAREEAPKAEAGRGTVSYNVQEIIENPNTYSEIPININGHANPTKNVVKNEYVNPNANWWENRNAFINPSNNGYENPTNNKYGLPTIPGYGFPTGNEAGYPTRNRDEIINRNENKNPFYNQFPNVNEQPTVNKFAEWNKYEDKTQYETKYPDVVVRKEYVPPPTITVIPKLPPILWPGSGGGSSGGAKGGMRSSFTDRFSYGQGLGSLDFGSGKKINFKSSLRKR